MPPNAHRPWWPQVTYNGRPFNDFTVQRASTYIEQTDEHLAELTCAPLSTVLITAAYPTSRIALKFGPHTAAASCLCLLTLLLGGEGIHVLREANKL